MKTIVTGILVAFMAIAPSAAFAGSIVVTTPSDNTNIKFTNGVASHVTSQYSAQINDIMAAPGEHVTVQGNKVLISQGNGKTSTITMVTK